MSMNKIFTKKLIKPLLIFTFVMILLLLPLFLWALQENKAIGVTNYHITDKKIPAEFASFRIAQISDLHNTEFGDENQELLELLRQNVPDIIVITGDLIDARRTNVDVALSFVEKAMEIAPCYYVSGNHEGSLSIRLDFQESLTQRGVVVLDNERVEIERNGQSIHLMGVYDFSLQYRYKLDPDESVMMRPLRKVAPPAGEFSILLSHRPELFDTYAKSGVDLVLTGHAHGGQARLPGIGGLIAPDQGLLPEYDMGVYKQDQTEMVVSRGLGNSLFPLRFNNPPELVMVELHTTQLKGVTQ